GEHLAHLELAEAGRGVRGGYAGEAVAALPAELGVRPQGRSALGAGGGLALGFGDGGSESRGQSGGPPPRLAPVGLIPLRGGYVGLRHAPRHRNGGSGGRGRRGGGGG